ncbi:MAG TPA: zinc ribbon domain-containing protein [Candidatus Angelobacter sp.]|jgi:putative FmdB family regulatory protein|nr:zinc ribbon domain-containing protein [Candidatus Angelobacter sp.]
MPIFDYICQACRHRFEAVVLGSQKPRCPECKSRKLEQQVANFSRGARKENTAAEAYTMRSQVAGVPRP